MDQGSTMKRSAVHNFAPTVTKFCVMWEGQALPHDTKFGNSRCEIVGRRVIFIWSLIHGLRWSGLIKAEPGDKPLSEPMMTYAWASYQIRKIAGCACAGNAGNVSPRRRFQRKPLVSDPGMHHGTCVTHVPWCMSGSLTCGDGENVPGIPGACAPAILRIWQEAHASISFDELTHWGWDQVGRDSRFAPTNDRWRYFVTTFLIGWAKA